MEEESRLQNKSFVKSNNIDNSQKIINDKADINKKKPNLSPVDGNTIKYYNTSNVNSPQYTDSNNSEDEGLNDYKNDGYHPVHIGEILLERYLILQKLGFGHFSTLTPNMEIMLQSKYKKVRKYICGHLMMKLKYYKN